jgi:hypothetical protein
MFRLARTPTRREKTPSARTSIMFFRAFREMFAFLSVYIIRVSDVQTCEDPNKKRMKTFSKTLRRARSFRASREKSVDKVTLILL